jgi:acetyltransferase-like isoleucine patch superfamily enzyme
VPGAQRLYGGTEDVTGAEEGEARRLADLPGYAWARRLPPTVKRWLLRQYWRAKSLHEDIQDYIAEVVGLFPSHSLRLWCLRHFCRMAIGKSTSIHRRCRMYHSHRIVIGSHSVINYGVLLDGRRGLTVGDNVSISEGTVILTLGHDVDAPDFALKGAAVSIGDRVFVGACARILPGVSVGEAAVIAAGAVVVRDVEPYTLVAGVPARFVRSRARHLDYQLDHRKRFG